MVKKQFSSEIIRKGKKGELIDGVWSDGRGNIWARIYHIQNVSKEARSKSLI